MAMPLVTAVRDYEYMVKFGGTADDPFVASSERRVDHKVLEEEMRKAEVDFEHLAEKVDPPVKEAIPTGPWNADDEPIWGRRYLLNAENTWTLYFQRLLAVVAADFFIIGPGAGIILAAMIPNQHDSLVPKVVPFIIVLVATMGWGMAMIATARHVKDVIGWTAGYAAVLGIFVTGAASLRQAVVPPPCTC